MAARLQAQDWGVMSPSRSRQTGFTVTELMVVLVIIGLLAAIATPSLTRDSTARKGRDFANMVAQSLQRAHLDAMSLHAAHFALVWEDSMVIYRIDPNTPMVRSLSAPPGVRIWDATTVPPPGGLPTASVLDPAGSSRCRQVYFNSMGNAYTCPTPLGAACKIPVSASCTSPASWWMYIRNENLISPNHPDAGFVISVTGLTAFVSTRNYPHPFTQ